VTFLSSLKNPLHDLIFISASFFFTCGTIAQPSGRLSRKAGPLKKDDNPDKS